MSDDPVLKGFIHSVYENLAEKLYWDIQAGKYELPPDPPPGNEKQVFNVGEVVIANGTGCYKEGFEIKITDVMCSNGWYSYYGAGAWHRTKDIRRKNV